MKITINIPVPVNALRAVAVFVKKIIFMNFEPEGHAVTDTNTVPVPTLDEDWYEDDCD
jgi:hypothetical protein